ncbi:MAG: hypothetical protein DRH12_18975, partial [Deltaproteobacteria bacterium]
MVIKVVHTADNHLDPTLRAYLHLRDQRRRDFWNSFKMVLDYSYKNRVDFLLISGDLFDKINPRNPIRANLMKWFKKLHDIGTRIVFFGGHHDMPKSVEEGASPIREFAEAGYVVFLSKRNEPEVAHFKVNDYDVCVSGMSYNFSLLPGEDPLAKT